MIDTAPSTRPITRTALTPRGEAVRTLIRADWLRYVAPNDREPAIYGVFIAVPGLTPADRAYLTELVEAHQD